MHNYRSFIRETKREVNKLTLGKEYDKYFEDKVNLYLNSDITQNEFDNYLDNELYLNINESFLITESLASKFADSVQSKVKSIFKNLYTKIKESKGFEMMISFFDKVASGISKFWKFLKKIKAGNLLKKLLITLGITSLASYILAQFGAGWVALMGGRMTASLIGKKVGDKVVKESLKHLMLFEEFNRDIYRVLNSFLNKINVSTNKLNSDLILKFYQNIIDPKLSGDFDQWKGGLVEILKLLKNATNSRNETRIKEALTKLKDYLSIDDKGNSKIISDSNLKSYLSKSDGKKFGNLHGEILSILSSYSLIDGSKDVVKSEGKPTEQGKPTGQGKPSPKGELKGDDEVANTGDDKKPSIWAKIGSGISKFFKILKKLKWAIVIFFGVVFILNLIFSPIFEPVLQVAQLSSFSMIYSDTFEETANAVGSIPKISASDVKLDLDITDDLPSDSEVTINLQNAVNDVKDNISDNPEAATNEVTDMVNNMKNDVLNDTEDIESDIGPSQEVEEEKGGFLKKLKDKIKGILPDDIDKVTKSIDKQGFEGISTNKISSGINKALESGKLDASDLDKLKNINGDDFYTFTSSSSSAARTALIEKLPSGYDSNLLVSKEIGGKTTWAYLLPKG